MITRINGKYGEDYFNDLKASQIAVNIHYSRKNLDDFESGIFEAMASGCAVISERLNHQTLIDLEMTDAIIQVDSPKGLKEKLKLLKSNPEAISSYLDKSKLAIQRNTWHDRAQEMSKKFQEVCNE
jgi:glycosyltransferase involved in cell wall biosynthesis